MTWRLSFYAVFQDSWKVNSDLTLNYGISWDAETPNQNAQFDHKGIVCWANSTAESKVFPGGPPGLSWPGDPGCNRAGGPTAHYNRFGPRIGFAWSPSGDAYLGIIGALRRALLTLIRGGSFGIYYNRDRRSRSFQNLEAAKPPEYLEGATDVGRLPVVCQSFRGRYWRSRPSRNRTDSPPPSQETGTPTSIGRDFITCCTVWATFDPTIYTVRLR